MSGTIIACGGCGSRRVRWKRTANSLPGQEWARAFHCQDCAWEGEPVRFEKPAEYGVFRATL